jgi:mRNA-degrading endonuclease RelE of RelBE toxin-antitoxin system
VRLEGALDAMEASPFGGDIKRLQPAGWRRRVGSFRIFYDLDLDERLILVTSIRRRTSTTY